MERKDIEEKLKKDAESIELQDFSVRWEAIKDRIEVADENGGGNVVCAERVGALSSGSVSATGNSKKIVLIVSSIVLSLCLIVLAIVLPIVLSRQPVDRYFNLADLHSQRVEANEFSALINDDELNTISFSKYELSSCALLYDSDNKLRGGKVDLVDETIGVIVNMTFYDNTVQSDFSVGEQYEEYEVNRTKIKYVTASANEMYSTKALAKGVSVTYEMTCLSITEEMEPFFSKMFS